jgi:hypothetical protein
MSIRSRNRSQKTPNRNVFDLQALESRQLMTAVVPNYALTISEVAWNGGTQLKIAGTKWADNISVTQTVDGIIVTNTGGWTSTTFTGTYKNIWINAGAGNDKITVDSSVTNNTYLYGSDGNDTINGGAGSDNIYGGNGNDSLSGNAGDDTLVSLGGGVYDKLTGGEGLDSFWLDNNAKTESVTDLSTDETTDRALHAIGNFRRLVGLGYNVLPSKELNSARLRDPKQTNASYTFAPFSNRPLFSDAGPSIEDVKQGAAGDCYYLAALASVAKTNATIIRNSVVDLGDGTYAVRFFSGNSQQYVRVDNDPATSPYDRSRPAYAKLGADNSMWVAVMEKAFCYFRANKGTYSSIESGLMDESFRTMGLKTTTTNKATDATTNLQNIKALLDAGQAVTTAIYGFPEGLNLVSYHAYTVDAVITNDDGSLSIRLRNPWGVDNYTSTDGANDGYVTLTATQAFSAMPFVMSASC